MTTKGSQQMRILAGVVAHARGTREKVAVRCENGRIVALEAWNDATRPLPGDIDARSATLVPGFIDIHVHGGAGRAVMEGTTDALDAIRQHLCRYGVTGFLATTVTGPWEQQSAALEAAVQRMTDRDTAGAAVLGCHLEGPYINPIKKGAQPEQYIRRPDFDDLLAHTGDYLAGVKIVTLAPEVPGALELIQHLVHRGIVASIGHTNATYMEMCAGIDAGARHVTHCFNAMRPLDSREPGVVGAALARRELTAELIWDNIHVHPASCCALINAKGAEGVILISDGIPGAGMNEGYEFSLGDLPVTVRSGSARLPDGTLAGSLLTLDGAFRNAGGYTMADRCRMTSRNAAIALGYGDRKGLIAPGMDGDLVILDAAGGVMRTFVMGETVYESEAVV